MDRAVNDDRSEDCLDAPVDGRSSVGFLLCDSCVMFEPDIEDWNDRACIAGETALVESKVLMLDFASFAGDSAASYSVMDAIESEPIEVMEGFPDSLRTKYWETEVLLGRTGEEGSRTVCAAGSSSDIGMRTDGTRCSVRLKPL